MGRIIFRILFFLTDSYSAPANITQYKYPGQLGSIRNKKAKLTLHIILNTHPVVPSDRNTWWKGKRCIVCTVVKSQRLQLKKLSVSCLYTPIVNSNRDTEVMERFCVKYYIKIMGCPCSYTGCCVQTRLLPNIPGYFYRTKVCHKSAQVGHSPDMAHTSWVRKISHITLFEVCFLESLILQVGPYIEHV